MTNPLAFIDSFNEQKETIYASLEEIQKNRLIEKAPHAVFWDKLAEEFALIGEAAKIKKHLKAALKCYYPEEKRGIRASISGLIKASDHLPPHSIIEKGNKILSVHNNVQMKFNKLKKDRAKAEFWVETKSKEFLAGISPESAFLIKQGILAFKNWTAKEDGRPSEKVCHKLLGYPVMLEPAEFLALLDTFSSSIALPLNKAS